MVQRFDAIIIGASFAGLAVASRLRGDVLVIDKYPIGSRQRSACGTFLSVPETVGLPEAVLQVSDHAVLHAPRVPSYGLADPLCTLDYERFCRAFFGHSSAAFLQASIKGLSNDTDPMEVVTDRGRFQARCVVDASGWRAVAASLLDPTFVDRHELSYGLETSTSYAADIFYFWLDRNVQKDGVAWIFPAGATSRIGLASYRSETIKASRVHDFLRKTGTDPTTFHGGFFPHRLRRATIGNVFLVGDSAGQCLPLTGEGIRPAVYFGQRCGDLVQQYIEGKLSLDKALRAYRRNVERFRVHYNFLSLAEHTLPRMPVPALRGLLRVLDIQAANRWCLRKYLEMMPLEPRLMASTPPGDQTEPAARATTRTSGIAAAPARRRRAGEPMSRPPRGVHR
jgi:flavin-dependent dehydrogenase